MESIETVGTFWAPDDTNTAVSGELTWEPGSRARVTLVSRVYEELNQPFAFSESGALSITHIGSPELVVADGVPRVILGDTALGPVTLVDAYLQHPQRNLFDFRTPLQQVWEPLRLIVGALLPNGNATKFDAVRFVLDNPAWWSHLPDGGSASDDAGDVVCFRNEDETWIEFRPSSPLKLLAAGRVVVSVITLASLALDAALTPTRVQLREVDGSDWLEVKSSSVDLSKVSLPQPHKLLLPTASLTLERLARWLAIEQTMDGLGSAVSNPVKGTAIQVEALVAGSLIEGIHKRIVGGRKDYVVRARDLHTTATAIIPDLTDPVVDWPKLIKDARNDLAHHNTGTLFDVQVYNWMIAETSIIWVLRLCLLSHVGISAQELRDGLAGHQKYKFYRENLKMHIKERDETT